MRIVYKKPWFWFLVKLFQPDVDFDNVAMSFGDTIYCSRTISAHQLVHEQVHVKHMRESKVIGILYFIAYAFSRKFRRECEIEAYQAQFDYIRNSHSDKELIEKARIQLAKHISSDVYPGMITYEEALQEIK
jgi:hypothetical protein